MKYSSLLSISLIAALSTSSHAATIFNDGFDYGGTDTSINGQGNWSVGSSVLKYDADGGLSTANVSGTGGSMWLDFNDARIANNTVPNFALSSLSAGGEMWISYLVDFTTGGAVDSTLSLESGAVSDLGFTLTSSGNFNVTSTLDADLNYTETAGALGTGVHHILFRATKGTGTSTINSQLDLWLNPANTASVGSLGAATWTLDSGDGEVKWGRDSDIFTTIDAGPSEQGRLDEIRIATSFSDLSLVPEPSSTALLGLGGLALILRRRR